MDRMEQLILAMTENTTQARFAQNQDSMPLTPVSTKELNRQQPHAGARHSNHSASEYTDVFDSHQQNTSPRGTEVMEIGSEHKAPFCAGEAHWASLLNEVSSNYKLSN